MEKPIEVIFLKQAEEFTNSIENKPKKKIFQAIRKTKDRLFGQWFTKLKSSDGIFEFRVDDSGKFFGSLHSEILKEKKKPWLWLLTD